MTDYSLSILYVDDETDQRLFLAAILEYRGFRIKTAKRAVDALQLIATEHFAVVIVDYELPDMTGAQLAQEIRAVEPSARVILFSGRAHLPAGELAYVDVHIARGSLLVDSPPCRVSSVASTRFWKSITAVASWTVAFRESR